MGLLYLLFESSSGYALFERVNSEEINVSAEQVTDLKHFSQIVKLKGNIINTMDSTIYALQNAFFAHLCLLYLSARICIVMSLLLANLCVISICFAMLFFFFS